MTWDMYDVFALGARRAARRRRRGCDRAALAALRRARLRLGPRGISGHQRDAGGGRGVREWLSKKTGKRYRLPTEAEWLHAAALAAGGGALDARRAWTRSRGTAATRTAGRTRSGRRQPDALGLFDLFGNAAEWVTTATAALVARGGSFRDRRRRRSARRRARCRTTRWNERDPQLPKSRWWLSDGPFVGFRVVRGVMPKLPKLPNSQELA